MTDGLKSRYGPAALVAGASEGLGEEYAIALARRGFDLVLVARREAKLTDLSTRLVGTFGVNVRTIAVDLGEADATAIIADETVGVDVGLLVHNAADSQIAPFLETPIRRHHSILAVNARSATELTHVFGRRMLERGGGGIILMTSLSAFQGSALIATYAATKAFLLSLAEALSYELGVVGVDVLAVCAGATRTPSYVASRPRIQGPFSAPEMDAAVVVEEAIAALGRKPVVIPGIPNRLSHVVLHRLLPRRLAVGIMGRAMERLYGSNDPDAIRRR